MAVYQRGNKLWLRFQGVDGSWQRKPSGLSVGEEAQAEAVLAEVKAQVATHRAVSSAIDGEGSSMTVRAYAAKWLAERSTETVADDRGRINNHIVPALGHIPLSELRPKHVQDFIEALKSKRKQGNRRKDGTLVPTDEALASRTVRHVYATLRVMMNDAVAAEPQLIRESPCKLPSSKSKNPLPKKADKDPSWRRTATFTRGEVETIISTPTSPEDRRVLAALMFLGAMRFGEAAALTWRDYTADLEPLGRIVVDKSYSTKARRVKQTKRDTPREMPVHPTLAKMLAAWKLGGFERLTGRRPRPDDLIVPSRRGAPRNVNHGLRRFHEDLERVGAAAEAAA